MSRSGYRHAPPKAAAMIESLRGLGYSTATALADVIDNSLAAHADRVMLEFFWDGQASRIAVLDNGTGMNDNELEKAMRLGERSPLDERSPGDLGRFGMGLKTASFSQCRQLTVASRQQDTRACLRWDLDALAENNGDGWYLLEGPAKESEAFLAPLESQTSGTLVLWERLDRIVTPGFSAQDYLDLIDRVERHLSMVFHRFLSGPDPSLRLTINGRDVDPWDPFLVRHPATWSSPIERINAEGGPVAVQCHVLPHRDRLKPSEHELAAGPDGWTAQQGFYIYRNRRLLVSGSWLGLGRGRSWTKEEAHRLARIRLDIPNTSDTAWNIDIRKSTARPPVAIRERLTRLAEDTRERARRVFTHRGRQVITSLGGAPLAQAWQTEHFSGGVRYRINPEHPAVGAVLDAAGPLEPLIKSMLRVLEETIPVQRIWLDTTEARETPRTGFDSEPPIAVQSVLEVVYANMIQRKGLSSAFARQRLLATEPFNQYPDLVMALPDAPTTTS